MATVELPSRKVVSHERADHAQATSVGQVIVDILKPLASLRLTVVLFALAIFLVFVGSLAQKDQDVWDVVNHYFREWVALVEFRTLERFVQIFAPSIDWKLSGGFPFPGGQMIGLALMVNLFAAHAVRFKVAATGQRLKVGLIVLAIGIGATALVIASGMNNTIESELSPQFCNLLWQAIRLSLVVIALAGAQGLRMIRGRIHFAAWWLFLAVEVGVAALAIWLLFNGDARLDDSGLRIFWQLIKGGGAAAVCVIGSWMVFDKRGGIVLLHSGVALIMLSETWTTLQAKETQIYIPEGATVNYSYDTRSAELAIVDGSDPKTDRVTVVPQALLASNVGETERIDLGELPLSVQVHRWLPNSDLRAAQAGEATGATTGAAQGDVAELRPRATGKPGDTRNLPAAHVEVFNKATKQSLGTYLVSPQVDKRQSIEVDGKSYDISLRDERIYWPFSMTLKDFSFDRYAGTNTPKNYSSVVRLQDPERHVDSEWKIWMNNPLRYGQMTFYQSGFDEETERATILQVVTNPGWMTPYTACMLVMVGMMAHFGPMLFRFLQRNANSIGPVLLGKKSAQAKYAVLFPTIVVAFFGSYVVSKTRMPKSKPSEPQIYEFAKLPLAYQGRVKPYDTLARNSLQYLSGRQELTILGSNGTQTKRPAIAWLLDVISSSEKADDHRVFRIENLDLLNALDLEPRTKFWCYSLNEIGKKQGAFEEQLKLAEAQPKESRSLYQRKVIELAAKRNHYFMLFYSFATPPLAADEAGFAESVQRTQFLISELRRVEAPHSVPPKDASVAWAPLLEAELYWLRDQASGQPTNPATSALRNLLAAHARGDAATFNSQLSEMRRAVAAYENSLASQAGALAMKGAKSSELLKQAKVNFEVFYNQFSPFYYASVMYLVAFVLGVASWLGSPNARRASVWLLWFTFALHTLALIGRIYVSGRPPITNLYSTAIFIGWGSVLFGLLIEAITRLGLGNIVAAVIGFLTLLVAHFLSLDGDTLIVMQAVLDTQFWLATHVITINMGYATTFLAGALGIAYVLAVHVVPILDDGGRNTLSRMIYGTLCFAILFSFVGTVLGGLWGDDSWGRFWGWDPKENGALMIVLYNALVLHARWGGIAKPRGVANLAIGGNIVVAWSYFGVNELGVGLHAYGASESSTAMWLLVFAASQLAIIALGLMPKRWFGALAPTTTATH
jgi:ABC-type transport system involved in cytochrome c biogenesis permease subunit